MSDSTCNEAHEAPESAETPANAGVSQRELGPASLEHPAKTNWKTQNPASGGAPNGARGAPAANLADTADPLRERLDAAWDRLSPADRERVIRFAESLPDGLDGADGPAFGLTTAKIRQRMADRLFG